MSLESGTYIDSLVVTNPTASDPKSEGDDHIRLLKSTVKATFPNVTEAVTATQAELNILDGVTATTAELNILDGVTATTAELNILGGVTATAAELNAIVINAPLLADLVAITGTDGQQVTTSGRTALGDGGGGTFIWNAANLTAEVTADTQQGIYVAPTSDATGASGAWVRQYSGNVHSEWFGGFADGTDVGSTLLAAGVWCGDNSETLELPAGGLSSSVALDWSAYPFLNVVGAGHYETVITFTADTDGILFAGHLFEGLSAIGIGAGATGIGIQFVNTQRKFVERVRAESFYDGIHYVGGNYTHFDFIFCVSNLNDGFVCPGTSVDSNAVNIGMMDLRDNGGYGFRMIDRRGDLGALFYPQQWSGGTIACHLNNKSALVTGRGHDLRWYEEDDVAGDVEYDSGSEGCRATMLFGTCTDNGENNEVIRFRVDSTETVQHSKLETLNLQVIDRDYIGQFYFQHVSDGRMELSLGGTSSDGSIAIVHPVAGKSVSLNVDGAIHSKKITNTDLAITIDVSGGNLIEVTNSSATTVTNLTSASVGQIITLVFMNNNTTFQSGTTVRLAGGTDFVGSFFDTLTLIYNDPDWHEISRSVNG
ncbi:MAG: hypothetical protein PF440_03535 [Thiomicrorhabdus sp.]|jgi:hypothetical protein|nr:hypothetical protein [Thiomicrorhabdus sp.]